ncbi:MAG: molybdopterin cofactor-binding domain-containing protein [Pseudomonadota bacterium]
MSRATGSTRPSARSAVAPRPKKKATRKPATSSKALAKPAKKTSRQAPKKVPAAAAKKNARATPKKARKAAARTPARTPIRTPARQAAPALPKKRAAPRSLQVVGQAGQRVDGWSKVDGSARYIDDLDFPGMLHAAVRTSDWPHAEITRIDVTDAQQVPGVVTVATWRDVPGVNQVGCVRPDQPLLVETRARWVGDRIALVAAEDPVTAQAAVRAVKVEATPLPGVFDAEAALEPDATPLHPGGNLIETFAMNGGDVDRAFAQAELVLEHRYVAPLQEHAYLEPQGVVAVPEHGGMTVYGSMQAPFYVQGAVARLLGLPLARVRVVQSITGGAFGGKEDYPSEPAACAALLAFKTGRPVKLIYSREQDLQWTSKRHRMVVHHRLAARRDGTVTGLDIRVIVDAGAYCGLTGVVAERANSSAVGPYAVPNVRVLTQTVYTCNPFGGAYRGFGAPQVAIAHEGQMDALARALGRDPLDLRRHNGVRPHSITAWGERLAPPVEYLDTLEAAARLSRWDALVREANAHNALGGRTRLGVGIGTCMYGCCLHAGGQHLEGSGALLQVHKDGSVSVTIGLTEMGQGAATVMARIAAEELGLRIDRVHVQQPDTAQVPDSGPTVASRTTTMAGHAVAVAARQVRAALEPVAAGLLGCTVRELRFGDDEVHGPRGRHALFTEVVLAAYLAKAHLAAQGWYAPPRKKHDRATGRGQPYSAYAYAAQVAQVEVDLVTGVPRVLRFFCAHDVGRAIYPDGVRGQIEGGCVQGMGYACSERLVVREGRILNPNFTDYLIPTIHDMPEIAVTLIESGDEGGRKGRGTTDQAKGPYGAKGIGEPSLIPAPAAVASAINHALGARLTELPLMPDVIMEEIARQGLDHSALLVGPDRW